MNLSQALSGLLFLSGMITNSGANSIDELSKIVQEQRILLANQAEELGILQKEVKHLKSKDEDDTSLRRRMKKSGGAKTAKKSGVVIEDLEVCHGDGASVTMEVNAYADDDDDDTDEWVGVVEFGTFTAGDDESILVDLSIESMILSYHQNYDDDDYSIDTDTFGGILANAVIYRGCTSLPCSSRIESDSSPSGLEMQYMDRETEMTPNDDDYFPARLGLEYGSVSTGRFLFQDLQEDDYLLVIEFDLQASAYAGDADYAESDVEIGEHVVVINHNVGSRGYCAPEEQTRNLKFFDKK